MTYRASGRKSAPARRPVGHFTSKECARNLGINAISLQPLLKSGSLSGSQNYWSRLRTALEFWFA